MGISAGGRGVGLLPKILPNCAAAGPAARLPPITSKTAAMRTIDIGFSDAVSLDVPTCGSVNIANAAIPGINNQV